jgi:hypothetical protein
MLQFRDRSHLQDVLPSLTPARPFNLLLGRRVTPNSQASAVGELGCFDIGLVGYIDRELCPALTQQELCNILVIHRANGLRWHAAGRRSARRTQRAPGHRRLRGCGRRIAQRPAYWLRLVLNDHRHPAKFHCRGARLTIAAAAMAIVRDGTSVWLASSSIVAGPAASVKYRTRPPFAVGFVLPK